MLLRTTNVKCDGVCHAKRHLHYQAPRPALTGRANLAHQLRRRAGQHLVCEASSQQQQALSSAVTDAPESDGSEGKFEVTLRGLEALQTIRLGLVAQGKGQAVVVTEVAEGSQAEQLGVRRGQKLNALSDPLRYGTMWSLQDRPSLRFVVDTFKMRRSSPIDLEFQPLVDPAAMDALFGSVNATATEGEDGAAASASTGAAPAAPAASSSSSSSSGSSRGAIDTFPDNALASLSSIDQMMGTSSDEEGPTIGERLAAKYAAQQRAQLANNQVQKRIDRRKAYMEIDDQRDDTGLLLGLAAAFLLPALVILIVAYFTGYLDRLYLTALTLR